MKLKKPRVIFIDIDGTLRTNNQKITKETKEAIRKTIENDIMVVLCTGRSASETIPVMEEAGTSAVSISSTGSFIFDLHKQEIIWEQKLPASVCKQLYLLTEKIEGRLVLATGFDKVVTKILHNDPLETLLSVPIDQYLTNHSVVQCLISSACEQSLRSIETDIEQLPEIRIVNRSKYLLNPTLPKPDRFYYDISSLVGNKGFGIQMFCRHFKIAPTDTVGIGDDYNDITMFETVGYAVAMANAPFDVRKMADEVTLSNEENGVAHFLKRFWKE